MLLLISMLLLFSNFISFYIYNLNYIEKQMTNREKHAKKKILFRLLFLDVWNISNKVFWIINFFNIVISTIGVLCFFLNLFLKNEYFEEIIGTTLIILLVVIAFCAIVSKLIINIKDKSSNFSKFILMLILVLYLVGVYTIISNGI